MSKQTFPVLIDQPGCVIHNFHIDGPNVGATAGSAGLDGRGKFLCTISKSTNTVTINWLVAFGDIPYVHFQPAAGQLNTQVQITTSTASQLVLTTVKSDDHTTGVNDAKLDVTVFGYNTTHYVS